MTCKCVIIDDEPLAIDVIAEHAGRTSFLSVEGRFTNSVRAYEYLSENMVDIVFIDIMMPDISGLELIKKLEYKPAVIFTTAFEQYALEGFRADAVDYLLKPVDYPEFLKAAEKAKQWLMSKNRIIDVKYDDEFLFIKSEYKLIRINYNSIKYIEGMSEYSRIHRENAKPVMSLITMKALEEKLPQDMFMRVHRSYIVNLKKITEIESNMIVCGDGMTIPVSALYREKFMEYVKRKFMF